MAHDLSRRKRHFTGASANYAPYLASFRPVYWYGSQVTTLLSAVDEIEGRKQLTDEEYAALKERVKEQGAIVKASKEARTPCLAWMKMSAISCRFVVCLGSPVANTNVAWAVGPVQAACMVAHASGLII